MGRQSWEPEHYCDEQKDLVAVEHANNFSGQTEYGDRLRIQLMQCKVCQALWEYRFQRDVIGGSSRTYRRLNKSVMPIEIPFGQPVVPSLSRDNANRPSPQELERFAAGLKRIEEAERAGWKAGRNARLASG